MDLDVIGDGLEIYWLAGLLEGEGSFLKGPPSDPNCPRIQLPMTDADVIEAAARLFRRSVMRSDRGADRGYKPVYITVIKGAAASHLMHALHPLMGERRRGQIDTALASDHPARIRWRGDATCTVSACARRVRSRGLCLQHYRSWWKAKRYGRPPKVQPAEAAPPPVLVGVHIPVARPAADDPAAVAWLAGLLEGEGTFANTGGYPAISATMCDRDVLERAAAIMGIATVSARDVLRNAVRGWSPAFQIGFTGARAAEWMRRLRAFMGVRRTHEIDLALAAYRPIRRTGPPQTCTVPSCRAEHRSRGLCHKHYMTWSRDRRRGREPRVAALR